MSGATLQLSGTILWEPVGGRHKLVPFWSQMRFQALLSLRRALQLYWGLVSHSQAVSARADPTNRRVTSKTSSSVQSAFLCLGH